MASTAQRVWTFTTPPFPSSLKLDEVSVPDLKPNEIAVSIRAAALNPVDVQLANAPIFRLQALSYPKGIGCDFAGVVEKVGSAVSNWQPGDEICGMAFQALGKPLTRALGTMAALDPSQCPIVKRPAGLSWAEAASVPLVGLTAITCLSPPYCVLPSESKSKPTVVVLGGSSGVGVYAVQLAVKKLNAKVIATCSSKNADFVKSLGASTVIDYTKENVVERLKALRPADGYLTIIDCVGGTELLPHCQSLLMPRSRVFKEGGSYVTIVGDKTSRDAFGGSFIYLWNPRMVLRNVLGSYTSFKYRYYCISLRGETSLLQEVFDDLKEGGKIVIDSEFEFDEADKAYEKLNTGRARGKIVVNVKS